MKFNIIFALLFLNLIHAHGHPVQLILQDGSDNEKRQMGNHDPETNHPLLIAPNNGPNENVQSLMSSCSIDSCPSSTVSTSYTSGPASSSASSSASNNSMINAAGEVRFISSYFILATLSVIIVLV
ncbi:uncharacterized protein RJT21DRAFT_117754 [Scheffersomyces amazonensis]|uniref:uncharacterized protein n=1 Tax=Scheffersomyces amazonensis TaxID=1078765 RepID=UPI00315DBD6D